VGLLKGHKGQTFEGGMRVPGIFWWPGTIEPGVVHGIGSLTDIYATALSIAGIANLPDDSDSIDISPTFKGNASPRDNFPYYSYKGELLGYRKGPWKVSFTKDGGTHSENTQLYNLQHDPSEFTDLSGAYPDLLKELAQQATRFDTSFPHANPIFDK